MVDSVSIFDVDLQKLTEERDKLDELIKSQLQEKNCNYDLIASWKKEISYMDNLMEIKENDIKRKGLEVMTSGDPVAYII